ncbi:MAG: hypothetical protein CL608_32030 [Anaerolineaceae bacterium]|nr:hypothetical protein [Anaerolineaceae bacterium]
MVNIPPPSLQPANNSVARQTAVGSTYTIAASAMTLVIGFTRSVILARLLFPEDFGLFALAFFFVRLLERVQMFGFTAAFIHKQDQTQAEVAAHFILRLGSAIVVIGLALAIAPLLRHFYPEEQLLAQVVIVITVVRLIMAFNDTPKTILTKQLQFRRLAVLRVSGSLLALFLTGWLAWSGAGVWSLVAQDFCFFIVELAGLWFIRRPWKLSLKTRWDIIKWYFQFGKYHFVSKNIAVLLDTFDDFWVGTFLGSVSLGFYAKAYEFAQYPRAVVAEPINSVFFPAFARLQHDRRRLSRAFFRSASLLVRVGFLVAGAFVFVTPEFVRLFLGEKWLPMQLTFQLMLIYTLLDPLLTLSSQLVLANGQTKTLAKIQTWQMIFFMPLVIIASRFFSIEGVAVAADLMLALGFIFIVPQLRHFVDFSLRQMVFIPILALIAALLSSMWIISLLPEMHTAVTLAQKGLIISVIYTIILLIFEREQLQKSGEMVKQLLCKQSGSK